MHYLLVFMHFLQHDDFMDYLAHYEASPRLQSQGLHAHDYYEFYFHINGGRLYCVDDTVFELEANQLILIPPLHMHGLVCDRDLVDYRRCWLYLAPETLNRLGFGKLHLNSMLEEAFKNQNCIKVLNKADSKSLVEIVQKVEKNSTKKNPENFLLEDYSNIIKLLLIIKKKHGTKTQLQPKPVSSNAIQEVLHYINENYTKPLSIKELSSLFYMSESSLSHEFRKYTNKGVYEYILYKRIIRAKELLFTDMSLTQIAMECGFNDYSNFLRVFEKNTACSPKKYRKNF